MSSCSPGVGPDHTADYLRRSALFVRERLGGQGDSSAAARTVKAFKQNGVMDFHSEAYQAMP